MSFLHLLYLGHESLVMLLVLIANIFTVSQHEKEFEEVLGIACLTNLHKIQAIT